MKKKLVPLLVAWLIGQWCQNTQTNIQQDLSDTLTTTSSEVSKTISKAKISYDGINLSDEQKNIIENTIQWYSDFFQCSIKSVTIAAGNKFSYKNNKNKIINRDAYREGNTIFLDAKKISNDKNRLEDIIIHELFHILKPEKATAILPYLLQDSYTMTGYHWLSIKVEKWTEKTKFGVIEDAAAEACAYAYKSTYTELNINYYHVGSFMLKMVKRWWINTDDLIQAQKNNDIDVLFTKIYNRNITSRDMEEMIKIFNDIYTSNDDSTNQAINTIVTIRNEKK
jgi:hypothetical protein